MADSYTRTHVGDLVIRPPVTVDAGATLRTAAETMFSEDVGLLVVTKHGDPIGVLSEYDMVSAIAQGADPAKHAVAEATTRFFISAEAHDTLLDAVLQMIDAGTRHVVVRHEGRLTGVLSIRDLLTPVLMQALALAPSEGSLPSATQARIWWSVATE